MNVPWNIETAHSEASKHFVLHYLRSWGWDFLNLRDAIRAAYKVDKVGKNKYEVYVQKKGFRKIIMVYYSIEETIFCITGSQGGSRT